MKRATVMRWRRPYPLMFVLAAVLLVTTSCAPTLAATVRPLALEDVETSSVDTSLPIDFGVPDGWRIRESGPDSVWVIAERGELHLSRRSDPDFPRTLEGEVRRIQSTSFEVAGPLRTTLLGEPAASYTVTGRDFTRVFVGSANWRADSQATHALDLEELRDIAAMLGERTEFPAPLE